MFKKLFLFLFLFNSLSFAFEFSPLGFDKRIDTGEGYGEFIYGNSGDEVVRYKINISSNGKDNDISKYVSVYPKILTIKPKSSGKVKVYVEAPPTLKKGIYGFMIGSESVAIPFLQKEKQGNVAPAVSFKTPIGLEMQAYVGEVGQSFEISNEKIITKKNKDNKNIKIYTSNLKNSTGRGYEIGVGFVDSQNSLIGVESMGRINDDGNMRIENEIPKFAKALVFYDYNNQKFVGQQIKIN